MKKLILAPVVLILLSLGLHYAANAQEMPDAQKNLQRFDGKWVSKDIKLTIGDKSYSGVFYFDAKSVLNGTGIYAEEGFDNKELGNMRGLNLMSYDPNLQVIHWYTIDDKGTCHDHLGHWSDRDHFFAQYHGIMDGKIYVEEIYFHFLSDSKIDFKLTGEYDGQVGESITGTFMK